jgi:hypothetical protein
MEVADVETFALSFPYRAFTSCLVEDSDGTTRVHNHRVLRAKSHIEEQIP